MDTKLPDKTLLPPLPSWHCRLCQQPIDHMQLRLDPGAVICWTCRWRLDDALEGRR